MAARDLSLLIGGLQNLKLSFQIHDFSIIPYYECLADL